MTAPSANLLSRAFETPGEPPLRPLPPVVADLLRALGAPPRLAAHLRAVHDVAARLTAWVRDRYPDTPVDHDAVLFGAATHDVGKILHPEELTGPGSAHETAGRDLLLSHGFTPATARFAATHASWDDPAVTIEDLLVSTADKVWKDKRVPDLEDRLVRELTAMTGREPWQEYLALDDLLTRLGADAPPTAGLPGGVPGERVKLPLEAVAPPDLAFVPFVSGNEPRGGGYGGGRPVFGVDVRDDGPYRLPSEPVDEPSGRFGGDSPSLPRSPHHPGDFGVAPGAGSSDRGLDGSGQAGLVAEPYHPVQPGDGRVGGARHHPPVARTESSRGIRGAADERIQGRIGQNNGHFLGMPDPQRQQIQPLRADGLGRHAVHDAAAIGAWARVPLREQHSWWRFPGTDISLKPPAHAPAESNLPTVSPTQEHSEPPSPLTPPASEPV